MDKIFYNIYKSIKKQRTLYLLLFFIVVGLLIWSASKTKFEEDISKLIPTNTENQELKKVLKTVNFADKVIVNISLKSNGEFSDLIDYATDFTDFIYESFSEYVKDIQGKVEDEDALNTIDFVYDNLPLFLNAEDYTIIDKKLNTESLKSKTEVNYKNLISPSGIITKSTIVKDPLGITFIGLKQLNDIGLSDNLVLKDGFLVTKDKKNVLLFITPKFSASDTATNEKFSEKLYTLQNDLNEHYNSKVVSTYFGGSLIAVANAQQIKTDIQLTVGIAMTILLLLFIFFYRKLAIPIILFIPTLFGGLLAISVLSLIRSEISAISLGIGAVLLGITLDYSLHILTHIRNKETVAFVYKNVTKPILMSSITTALAFLCLLFINSQALQDLGVFAAVSVIGASVFALVFIPLAYKGKNRTVKETFIDKIAKYEFNKNFILIGSISILLIVSIFTFGKVEFNQDLSQLNFIPEHLKKSEKQLDAITNLSSKSLYVVAFGNSSEDALQQNDSAFKLLQSLKNENKILGFNSIGAIVNSKKSQKRQIEKWKQFWSTNKIEFTKSNLTENGIALGFKPNTFETFYQLLNKDFQPLGITDYYNLATIPVDDFVSVDSEFTTITSIVKVDDDQITLIKENFEAYPKTLIIDRQTLNESFLGTLKQDFNSLILYSFIVIFILLLGFYRNIKLTIITILPILLTWFLTLGLMGLFQLKFNIFNIIITTFIFGLGVDYSIFMTNGLQHSNNHKNALATHKASVILSVITTIMGVGVLIFAKHPALHSIALIAVIGILCALLIAFTIQPLLFNILIFKSLKKKDNGNH